MTYDVLKELSDTADYFLEEYAAPRPTDRVGNRHMNAVHGTTIRGLCRKHNVSKAKIYSMRNGLNVVLNMATLDAVDMMGYEVHLIPKDKVKQCMDIAYGIED